jgi:hypothetical protein
VQDAAWAGEAPSATVSGTTSPVRPRTVPIRPRMRVPPTCSPSAPMRLSCP